MTTRALVEAALVGTARQPDRALAALGDGLPAAGLVARTGDAMPIERRVLLAAAANDACGRAGRTSTSGVAPLAPAQAEARPVCSAAASALIGELVALRPHHLLKEALERLDAAGEIVAPARLPELLDTRDELLATALPRVIGERGRWLAALTGDGDWLAVDAPDEEEARRVWAEGTHARRVAVLRARRVVDTADARAWLAESWTNESAEHRAHLVGTLEEGLNADDAAFLEDVLNDRSVVVRIVAARLLAQIRESDAAHRFATRADAMLDYEPPARTTGVRSRVAKAIGRGDVGRFVVRPPGSFDPSWERDALSAKPPRGIGERAHWLVESLTLVRPAHWQERFGASPSDLLQAARATDWYFAVLEGWSRATRLARDAAWATALWDAWHDFKVDSKSTPHEVAARGTMMLNLHRHLPRAEAEARVLELMSRPLNELPFSPVALVDVAPRPWSASFGVRFLERLRERLTATAAEAQWLPGSWLETLSLVALALPPESFADALGLERRLNEIDSLSPAFRRKLDELRDTVLLRQRIHQEIRVEPAHR